MNKSFDDNVHIQVTNASPYLASLYCSLRYWFCLFCFLCCFHKFKVCGNPAPIKSIGSIFSNSIFSDFVSQWESPFLGRLISLGIPKERGVSNSQGGGKDQLFFSLHSLGLCNNDVYCLRTASGKNLLANPRLGQVT